MTCGSVAATAFFSSRQAPLYGGLLLFVSCPPIPSRLIDSSPIIQAC